MSISDLLARADAFASEGPWVRLSGSALVVRGPDPYAGEAVAECEDTIVEYAAADHARFMREKWQPTADLIASAPEIVRDLAAALRATTAPAAEAGETIRVWLRGPITVTEGDVARVEGEFRDVPPDTRASHMFRPGGDPDPWEITCVREVRETRPWIDLDGAWVSAYVEAEVAGLRRQIATLRAERAAITALCSARAEGAQREAAEHDAASQVAMQYDDADAAATHVRTSERCEGQASFARELAALLRRRVP